MTSPAPDIRLNRFLARAGFGSRRSVEELVRQGKVRINGEVVTDLGRRVDPEADSVVVDGQQAESVQGFRVYAFHKPLDVVATLKAQGGQPSLLPYKRQADLPERFMPIGRLDSDSSGLLLWTDDGDLNQRLCRPDSSVWKVYQVHLAEPLPRARIAEITGGTIVLDGRPCKPCRLEENPPYEGRSWTMQLHEGRKRQIRRMFRAVGNRVSALHRVQFGPVRLGKLRPGGFRPRGGDGVGELRRAAWAA